jgi:predicted  nucleic acid-binding Zn-ribbon protein
MAKNTLTVTDINSQIREAPDFDVLTVVQSNTDYLHGDGFWPLYMDKMAKVTPGTGLNIRIADYYALVDGYKLFTRGLRTLKWDKYITINIPSTWVGKGDFYLLLRPKFLKNVDLDGDGIAETPIKEHGTGEFYFDTTIPSDGAIPVAKLNIPAGTTQITESMIDNSVKVWLPDIQKSLREMKKYVDEAVERAKREIYNYILNEYTPQIRNEIAQGDATIRAELDAKCNTLQNQINDLSVSISTIRQSLYDLQTYVSEKITTLTTRTDALNQAISDLNNAVSENSAFIQQLSNNISNIEGEIIALQLENQYQAQQIQRLQLQSSVSQGVSDLENTINIIKINWQIQQLHNLGINQMYKGYTDILKDDSNIDKELSSNYTINSFLSKIESIKPAIDIGTLSGIVSWWKFDEGMGNVVIDSINGYNGIIYGPAQWVSGKFGSALYFNGRNNQVVIPDMPAISGSFSVSVWANVADTWWGRTFIGSRSPYECGFDAKFDGGRIHGDIGDGNDWLTTGADVEFDYQPNVWYHIVYVVTPDDWTIYINGNQVATGEYGSSGGGGMATKGSVESVLSDSSSLGVNPLLCDPNHILTIGNYCMNGYEWFYGAIDEVAIFDRALTADEVMGIYNASFGNSLSFTPGTVITKPVNYGIVPTKAVVSVVGNDITTYISRDNGTTWTQITPDTEFTFTNEPSGSDIRLKFTLDTPNSYIDNYGLFIK